MRIVMRLMLGFLGIALLVGIVGYTGINTTNTIKEQTAISDALRDLVINLMGDRDALHEYILTGNLTELTQIKDKIGRYDELIKMWILALKHGTDSAEFKSKEVYKIWRDGGYEVKGRGIKFDQEIAGKIQEIEKVLDESEEAYYNILAIHDKKIASEAKFNEEFPEEKAKRYEIQDITYKVNDPILLKDTAQMIYYSKEALFQYKDEKHINAWYDSITKLRTDSEAIGGEVLTPAELSALSKDCDEYYLIAKSIGNITLEIKQAEIDERVKIAVSNEYMAKIDKKKEEIISITILKTNEARIGTTSILIAVTILALVLAIILGFLVSYSISKPITKLKDAAADIGKGKFDLEIGINSKDEIGELASAFNKMKEDLKKSGKELDGSNVELGEMTKKLQSKVDELEKFNKFAVDRELKMVELKKRMKELEGK